MSTADLGPIRYFVETGLELDSQGPAEAGGRIKALVEPVLELTLRLRSFGQVCPHI